MNTWTWQYAVPFMAATVVWVMLVVLILQRYRRRSRPLLWIIFISNATFVAGVKTLDLLVLGLPPLLRQVVLILALGLVLASMLENPRKAFARVCGLVPARWPNSRDPMRTRDQKRRLFLAISAVVGPAVTLIVSKDDQGFVVALSSMCAGALTFVWIAVLEIRRFKHYSRTPEEPEPARDLLWTVWPAWLVLTVAGIVSIVLREPGMFGGALAWKLLNLVFVTALGEELIFRGILLGMALAITSADRVSKRHDLTSQGYWVVSIAFGLWHVGDAILDGRHSCWSAMATAFLVGATVIATTLASRMVLIPLRLRTGTLAAPILLHFAANLPGIVLASSAQSSSVCFKAICRGRH